MAKTYTNPDPKRNNTGLVVTFEGANPPKSNITIDAFNDDTAALKILK